MKRNSAQFVKDIIDAMLSIEKFVGKKTIEQLKKDDKTSGAVVRKFEIIGEAAKSIPSKVKEEHKAIAF